MLSERERSSAIMMPKQNNLEIAYNEAVQELVGLDIYDRSEKSGVQITKRNGSINLRVPFLNEDIVIEYPTVIIYYSNKKEDVPFWLKILILHYINFAKGTPISGEQITYKQVEGGLGYYSAFQRRSIHPIIKNFGKNIDNFLISGERIGGIRALYGDYSITFQAFPRVSLTYIIWEGDEEFPIDGSVIFDSSIVDYLTSEDIAMLCNMISVMIIKKGLTLQN